MTSDVKRLATELSVDPCDANKSPASLMQPPPHHEIGVLEMTQDVMFTWSCQCCWMDVSLPASHEIGRNGCAQYHNTFFCIEPFTFIWEGYARIIAPVESGPAIASKCLDAVRSDSNGHQMLQRNILHMFCLHHGSPILRRMAQWPTSCPAKAPPQNPSLWQIHFHKED